ncbi:uncharacterized protein LOC110700110 [Chenopodium quinoa]|uniref:uncharacterized protein LOC110700110 n=1 Tax=Chenopodium quinoa TaxID=63459 RepID=UPI000B798C24|nr:uncharacterized protein LOC110700110 [Chenopodium quinoa]
MDRSWISTSKPGDPQYEVGIREFINFAMKNAGDRSKLPCPCFKCHNFLYRLPDEILSHLSKTAFDRTYTIWKWHGETNEGTSTTAKGTHDDEGLNHNGGNRLEDMMRVAQDQFNENPTTFERMLSDYEKPLYQGCKKYTRLSVVLRLYNLKAGHGLTDSSFTDILELIKDMLPDENVLPRLCNVSRYKKKEGVPAKVLWYFPIIPKFKHLFSHASNAEKLTWHSEGRKKDGKLRHSADSPQWRFIDAKFHEFAKEKRNLRLALSTDGMNPFGNLSSSYSTWPVVLVTYNLPPSLCMKRKYMMLSLLISGPKQPGNDIDVYLAPLIDDLMTLWEKGVEAFDAHRNEMFNLRAMLFCTIQDYPAYGNLSGYTVKGC